MTALSPAALPPARPMRARARLAGWFGAPWRALRAGEAALAALDAPEAATRRRLALDLGVLGVLGAALVALTIRSAQWRVLSDHPRAFLLTLLAQLALYGLAAGWVIRRRPHARGALALILLVALATRLLFVPLAPSASDDLYRYVWDGRIQALGINPYRYTPNDPALAPYRDAEIYPHINRQGVPTIYPPVAQFAFRALYRIHPDSVVWTKLALSGLDLLTVLAIAGLLLRLGLRPERAILYAWHPLLVLEVSHSGHLDMLMILFLILAVRARVASRPWRAGFLLACAALTKFYALIALPALLRPERRRDLRLPLATLVTAALAYLPFLGVGSGVFGYLGGYVREEGVASGDRFYLLQPLEGLATLARLSPPGWLPGATGARLYTVALLAIMGVLALWCWLRPLPSPRAITGRVLLLFTVFMTLATPTYPWYTLLVLAFIPFAGRRLLVPATVLVGGAGLLYLQWWWPGGLRWPPHVAYGGPALALGAMATWALVGRRGARRRPPSPPAARHSPRIGGVRRAGRSAASTCRAAVARAAMPVRRVLDNRHDG